MPHIKLFITFFKVREKEFTTNGLLGRVATEAIINKTKRAYAIIRNFELIF